MLSRILGVLTLRSQTLREIANDRSATGQAALVVIIISLLGGVGGAAVLGSLGNKLPYFPSENWSPVRLAIVDFLYLMLGWLFVSWVFAYVSRIILKSRATTLHMARVFGFSQVFAIFAIIPLIGNAIAYVLSLIAAIIGIREASRFDTRKAIITAVVGYVVYTLIIALINFGLGPLISPQ